MAHGSTKMIFGWTATVGALMDEGAEIHVHCSSCAWKAKWEPAGLVKQHGRLYTLWNRNDPCPPKCGGHLVYCAIRPNSGTWQVILRDGEQGQVDHMEAEWRADRVNQELGGALALRVMVQLFRLVIRWGLATRDERARLVDNSVADMPKKAQADARWLLEYWLDQAEERPGWR